MELIDLPLELFQAIMAETIAGLTCLRVVQMRLVSKLFNTEVQRAMFKLPVFDNIMGELECFARPRSLGTPMTTRLILSKMKTSNFRQRPLCLAITRVVNHLENHYEQEASSRLVFIEGLAKAAARHLSFRDTIAWIAPSAGVLVSDLPAIREKNVLEWHLKHPEVYIKPQIFDYLAHSSDEYADCRPQEALIAALATRRFHLANRLLEEGVEATMTSPVFGSPLRVAAAVGAHEFVQKGISKLLEQAQGGNVEINDKVEKARLHILCGAAEGGYEGVVQFVLEELKQSQPYTEKSGRNFDSCILIATENHHENIAMLLLQHRTRRDHNLKLPASSDLYGRQTSQLLRGMTRKGRYREYHFWEKLWLSSRRHGCKDVKQVVAKQKGWTDI